MTQDELYEALDYVNHSRERRAYFAQMVIDNPDLFPKFIKVFYQIDEARSARAAWVIEFATKKDIATILPHLDTFLPELNTIHLDSAVRPAAKVIEYLSLAYYKKQHPLSRKHLQAHHKELMISHCFDWLITDQKVAPKAYSMTSLFLLGTEYDWVHPELYTIMEEHYHDSSAAYKARCRHMFEAIKKFQRSKNA